MKIYLFYLQKNKLRIDLNLNDYSKFLKINLLFLNLT